MTTLTEHFSPATVERLAKLNVYDASKITDALFAWVWAANANNSDFEMNRRSAEGKESHAISPSQLHRQPHFKSRTKESVDKALDLLQRLGVFGEPEFVPARLGRPPEMRVLSVNWVPLNVEDRATLETSLVKLLLSTFDPPASQTLNRSTKGPLRILHDTAISLSNSFWTVTAGTIIDDPKVCKYLIETNAPAVPVDVTDMAYCPQCSIVFDVNLVETPDPAPLIVRQDCQFSYGSSMVKLQRGQIIDDRHMIPHLLEQRFPVAIARRDEFACCPKCRHAVARASVLGQLGGTKTPVA
jgi:hypothetical protein